MQYFQGPNTKQIFGRSRLVEAEVVDDAVAADASGAAARAPTPTVTAASTDSTNVLSLDTVSSCPPGPPHEAM
jgi:hypothetical protein